MAFITIIASYHNYINCSTVDTINGLPVTFVKEEQRYDTSVYIYTAIDKFNGFSALYTLTYLREYPHLSSITCLLNDDTTATTATRTHTLCDSNVNFIIKYQAKKI